MVPDCTLESCPPLDLLVVPGGWGTRREIGNKRLLEWIAARAAQVETLTSVCTGAMLLGHAGLLDEHRATTHWRSLDWMRESFPRVTVEDALHVVEDGHVLTSAGISAGIDMALRVVTRICGRPSPVPPRAMEIPSRRQHAAGLMGAASCASSSTRILLRRTARPSRAASTCTTSPSPVFPTTTRSRSY